MSRRCVYRFAGFIAVIIVFHIFSGCGYLSRSGQTAFSLRSGDLLFQELNGSPFFEAVAKVTQGYGGAILTHVGIASQDENGSFTVIEALQEGVVVTPLNVFLQRSIDGKGNPKVLVGRIKRRYAHLIESAIAEALSRKGKPYNHLFDIKNEDAYYCSELVYVAFRNANSGQPLFDLQPMTFVDPDTKEIFPVWKDYFAQLGADVPEGKPGINPGGISCSPALDIVHAYGTPTGWNR